MKIIMIVLGCLILSGCANQNVICIREDNIDEGQMKEVQKIAFINNKIDKYNIDIQFKVNNDALEYKKVIFESLKNSFDRYNGKDGIKYTVQEKDKSIEISIKGNYDKMSDELRFNKDASLNEVIDVLKDDGYTCKY